MIQVSVMYPYEEGEKFDLNYYLEKHTPMVKELLGDACKKISVQHGLSGPDPDSPAVYTVMCHLYFNSVDEFQKAFGPVAGQLLEDIPNYSESQPVIQISEVKV